MSNSILKKTVKCPGCGRNFSLDKLKKHIRRIHGFKEPFSLSQAVLILSGGLISAADLYSEQLGPKSTEGVKPKDSMGTKKKSQLAYSISQGTAKSIQESRPVRTKKNKTNPAVKPRVNQNGKYLPKNKRLGNANKGKGCVVCVLCGEKISSGHLLEHKQKVHGEDRLNAGSHRLYRTSNLWVQVVSGGLPSLGKSRH